jgi:alkylated DNA repair protein alkB family protein 7
VIHHFRESLVSAFPPSSPLWPDLIPLLNRAYALLPSNPQITGDSPPNDALTHLLHLAPEGEILPHVDNLDASGGVILGICLGAERVLGMTRKAGEEGWEVVLPNGCVYLQR